MAGETAPLLSDAGSYASLEARYDFGESLGKGGFGTVHSCTDRSTGQAFACKKIAKRLTLPNVSEEKHELHQANIRREVEVLRKLRGSLSVVQLEGVYEDDEFIYIIMEKCTGGELWRPRGHREWSETAVAGYMRSVLRTLAQCHSKGILHRDVKPGNFMLLDRSPGAALKAIDFGMAVFYKEDELPLTDLGLDGTAWFMAPEVLNCEAWPASDVWAAGVMAYQLLSGFLPFNDFKNPDHPALSLVWRSILMDRVSFTRPCWADISDSAKDFIQCCLERDVKKRPSALSALAHPWLATTNVATARPLAANVVSRIQQFGTRHAFQRSLLPLIANELLQKVQELDSSQHGAARVVDDPEAADQLREQASAEGCLRANLRAKSVQNMASDAFGGLPEVSVEGHSSAGILKSRSALMLAALAIKEGSVHSRRLKRRPSSYASTAGHETQKIGRLALEASGHDSNRSGRQPDRDASLQSKVLRASMFQWEPPHERLPQVAEGDAEGNHEITRSGTQSPNFSPQPSVHDNGTVPMDICAESRRRGGKTALRQLSGIDEARVVEAISGSPPAAPKAPPEGVIGTPPSGDGAIIRAMSGADGASKAMASISLQDKLQAAQVAGPNSRRSRDGSQHDTVHGMETRRRMRTASRHNARLMAFLVRFVDSDAKLEEMRELLRSLRLSENESVQLRDFKDALARLGFELTDVEAEALLRFISSHEQVARSRFVASQLDWNKLRESHTEMWLECARQTFQQLDADANGILDAQDIMQTLRGLVGDSEVDLAVEEEMVAACAESCGLTFEQFVDLLENDGPELLATTAFEDRYSNASVSLDSTTAPPS